MKARTKKLTAISLGLIMGTSTFATVLQAETITKTLKATYNNIKVTFNGDAKQPANEPFLINGAVYVSLRDAGQITGNTVNWDSANKIVQITNSNTGNTATESELADKNFQIANKNLEISSLQSKVSELESKLAKFEKKEEESVTSSNLTKSAIEKTLEEIEKKYDSKYNIRWDFELTENKGILDLDISIPKSSSSNFNDLSQNKLESFLESICKDISYNHKNVEINGLITDEKLNEEVLEFTYSTKGKFSIDNQLISQYALDSFAKELSSDFDQLPQITYKTLSDEDFDITNIELDLNKNGELITFFIGVKTTNKADWNALFDEVGTSTSNKTYYNASLDLLDDYLAEITDTIYDQFDIEQVSGMIYNVDGLSNKVNINKGTLMLKYEDESIRLVRHR